MPAIESFRLMSFNASSCPHDGVLDQPEMESRRFPLASIPPLSAGPLGGCLSGFGKSSTKQTLPHGSGSVTLAESAQPKRLPPLNRANPENVPAPVGRTATAAADRLCKRPIDYADSADVWNVRRRRPELKIQ